jgi:hypothetical protein
MKRIGNNDEHRISELAADIIALNDPENNLFDGTYYGYSRSSGTGNLTANALAKMAKIPAEAGATYHIYTKGNHNRFILYGSAADTTGTPMTIIYQNPSVSADQTYTYTNTTFAFLWVLVAYDYNNYFTADLYVYKNNVEAALELYLKEKRPAKYRAEFQTVTLKTAINGTNVMLSLIATKRDNTRVLSEDVGYLYLDEAANKLYYSSPKYDNPEYLCDWDKTLAGDLDCKLFNATITPEGDIIFVRNPKSMTTRTNPIVYKRGDYGNPVVVDLSGDTQVFGWIMDASIDHHPTGGYFMFGEYRLWDVAATGTELYIWKVVSPYYNAANWTRVKTVLHSHYNAVGTTAQPTNEIAHFHTMHYDLTSNSWIASTGDVTTQVRVYNGGADGTTWTDQNLGGGQSVRFVGMVTTKDYAYYQCDSGEYNHVLYRVPRTAGALMFANRTLLTPLSNTGEAGYRIALMRDPYGLLMIDRAEPRTDGYTSMYFYSLDDNKLYNIGTYTVIADADDYDDTNRYGFPPLVVSRNQSPYEDGIICGTTTNYKPLLVDILGNKDGHIIGVIKVKVVRVE